MKIERKSKACAGCEDTEKKIEGAEVDTKEVEDKKTESVESAEDINDVADTPEDDIEAKKNLGLAKQFYQLASEHVKNAIDALGDAASNGDKYAKQEIADLSVILFDLKNLQRM